MGKELHYWETIDYIGSGYVLQTKKCVHTTDDEESIERFDDVVSISTKTVSKQKLVRDPNNPHAYIHEDVDVEEITDVEAVERVIHISKVDGIDTSSLKEDIGNATLK